MSFTNLLDLSSLTDKLIFFFFSTILWTLLFLIVNNTVFPEKYFPKLSKKNSDDIRNRVVSIFHGLFSFFATMIHIFKHNPDYGMAISEYQHFLIIVSSSYFFYDSIACIYYGLTDIGLIVHHGLVLFGYAMDEFYGFGGTETLMGLFYAEISNSPMHMRKILKSVNLRHTNLHELFELVYLISYIIARGIFIPIVVYNCLLSTGAPIIVKCVCFGLFLQSMFYIKEMMFVLRKSFRYYQERIDKKVEYFWLTENKNVEKLSYYRKEEAQKIF